MLNVVNLVGRAGTDPEVRYFESGSVLTKIPMAVKKPFHDPNPEWFELEMWGKNADTAGTYVRKGNLFGVQGSLAVQSWTDKNTGEIVSKPVIKVDRIELLPNKKENE